ncbi:MAG: PaaI family thioesterase [Lachnospiraceae bacterium]|nr:PaaI family thioesterase [Lachnospiraceae bacterium]
MGNFKSLEELREFFKKDKYATNSGMVVDDFGEDYSVCSVVLNDNHKNGYGGVMGGVMFTLADFAFAVLSNNVHQPTVAQQMSINFLSAPKGTKLIATAKLKKTGKSSTIVNIDIVDDLGRDIAQVVGTGFKL